MNEFWNIVTEIKATVSKPPLLTHQRLADSYEVAGAIDVVNRYFLTGDQRYLADGMRRLEAVFDRQGHTTKIWAKKTLPRLREIAMAMSASQRQAMLDESAPVKCGSASAPGDQSPRRCDLLVVAALHDPELTAFLAHVRQVQSNVGEGRIFIPGATYYTGVLGDVSRGEKALQVVAVFQNRPGMTDCAIVTAVAIETFHPRLAAMTGVTAGREQMRVKLNDLLIPNAVLTCDTGKHSERGFQREPLWTEVSDRIVQRIRVRGSQILKTLVDRIGSVSQVPVEIPTIHSEVMACGSAVIDFTAIMDEIAGAHRKIAGVDMESYAFLRAARLTDERLPAFVVKGVMDLGSNKSDQEKEKAAFWAASFLASFSITEFGTLVSNSEAAKV